MKEHSGLNNFIVELQPLRKAAKEEEIITSAGKKDFKLEFRKDVWQGKELLNLIKFNK